MATEKGVLPLASLMSGPWRVLRAAHKIG